MSNTVICVENLSKRYRIGLREDKPDTFVGASMNLLLRPLRNLNTLRKVTFQDNADKKNQKLLATDHLNMYPNPEESLDVIWALRDVSFQVESGQVVGIIGKNGAGKSTLLKILSRITYPTHGRVKIRGRMSSLLEVGTGFHPELTGRENVYLNGAILGMTKKEIDQKFDDIVSFSGVEKFIDTPVKRYSSGMHVRLAFSVAAHLEPDILVVDEVLAVGDLEFQKKCLGKMESVAQEGRTVIFVSHNMSAISELCTRGIYLKDGKINFDGNINQAISNYINSNQSILEFDEQPDTKSSLSLGKLLINDNQDRELVSGMPNSLSIGLNVYNEIPYLRLNFILYDSTRSKVFHLQSTNRDLGLDTLKPGKYSIQVKIPSLWLTAGGYTMVFKAREFANPNSDQKIESDYLPVVVVGAHSKVNATLTPETNWLLSQVVEN